MKKIILSVIAAGLLLLSCSCNNIEDREWEDKGVALTETEKAAEAYEIPPFTEESEKEPDVTDEPVEAPEENSDGSGTAVISFGGDVTQSDVFGEATLARDFTYPLENVSEIFSSADIAFLNLETSVSDRGESEKKEGFGFRTEPKLLEVFTSAGIDIVSTANNHTRDYGIEALTDTVSHLDEIGLKNIGAGATPDEAYKLEIFEVNGIKIGFTAFNQITISDNGWKVTEEKPGIASVYSGDEEEYLERISEYDKLCDVLLVSAHWGIEYSYEISEEQEAFAHSLCDNGADIILGHHPHVLQPIESYNGSVIFYSLGNFLFYKIDDFAGETAVFTIEIDKNGFVSGKMEPVNISYCQAVLLDEENELYGKIIGLQKEISEPYGIIIDEKGDISCS